MKRALAILWLLIVIAAVGYLGLRVHHGLHFRTDLTALLPREDRNESLQNANDTVIKALSQRLVILVGDQDRQTARQASQAISGALSHSGIVTLMTNNFAEDRLKAIGKLYYPYRHGLLSEKDRAQLQQNQGDQLAARAMSQIYGLVGMANGPLLKNDPFLLLPSFFSGLPMPLSRLTMDDGMLSVKDGGTTWILIAAQLNGDPYALDTQEKLLHTFDGAIAQEKITAPNLSVLRLGAAFFAKAGAQQAMNETSTIGVVSILGTILLILVVFRAIRPIGLSLLVIGVGIIVAFAASLLAFGELHIGAMLFGTSLIGVAVDYSLQYCTEIFAAEEATPHQRLRKVLAGITIGTATTVIGYLTLFLAPFPGLHQIALFSAFGLVASWLTVVLWLPFLDRAKQPTHGTRLLKGAASFLHFWESPAHRRHRLSLLTGILILGLIGIARFHFDDDVRHMQSLDRALAAEQTKIQGLIGTTNGSQFFLIQAPTDELALQQEEKLTERLTVLVSERALKSFQSPSQFVPSAARQIDNQQLAKEKLYDSQLATHLSALHLSGVEAWSVDPQNILTLDQVQGPESPFSFLSIMLPGNTKDEVRHVVMLDGVTNAQAMTDAATGLTGVHFVDPAEDFDALLTKYRNRALTLIAISALLMSPLLIWRYGFKGAVWVLTPPILALLATPAITALLGDAFTFFDAMALVLVLSIGVDYAVFCAETSGPRKPVTMLAVALAACTAILSFGLLALSQAMAVHNFGLTMLIGILLSFLLAPLARRGIKKAS